MDAKDIEQLIQLMRRMGVMHLALEQPEYKISITRGPEAAPAAVPAPTPAAAAPAPVAPPTPAGVPSTRETIKVPSPVVGQVRSGNGRPLPGVGERVRLGQLLATVEAMKVPNEVRSPAGGVVSSVLVEEGSPVEFGQTLLVILPEEGGETDEDETPLGVA